MITVQGRDGRFCATAVSSATLKTMVADGATLGEAQNNCYAMLMSEAAKWATKTKKHLEEKGNE